MPKIKDTKDIIVGYGEIGKAVYKVFSPYYKTEIQDRDIDAPDEKYRLMHICFGWSAAFEREVQKYKKKFRPQYIVIHSTVPVGTSRRLKAFHSPVEGKHPHLAESIKTFTKFIGGKNTDNVADIFRYAGLKVQLCRKQETTEFAKIASTSYYAWCIEYVKEIEKLCNKYKIPFSEAFTLFQKSYNKGYRDMGNSEYQRPILQPLQKKQGGHCMLPNLDFLDSDIATFIKKKNML